MATNTTEDVRSFASKQAACPSRSQFTSTEHVTHDRKHFHFAPEPRTSPETSILPSSSMLLHEPEQLADFLGLLAAWPSASLVTTEQSEETMRPTVLSQEELSTRFRQRENTSLGLHWDNISLSNSSSQATCACCDTLATTVTEYRDTVSLLYRRWLLAGEAHRAHWQDLSYSTQKIHCLTRRLRKSMFPVDGFFNETMTAASDEELMVFVCRYSDMSHRLRLSREEPSRYDWPSVFDLSTRTLCHRVLQPFHVAASKASMRVTRLPMQLIQAEEEIDDSTTDDTCEARKAACVEKHFVGAVAASGLVVGFVYTGGEQ